MKPATELPRWPVWISATPLGGRPLPDPNQVPSPLHRWSLTYRAHRGDLEAIAHLPPDLAALALAVKVRRVTDPVLAEAHR